MKLKKPLIISGILIVLVMAGVGYFFFSQPKTAEMVTTQVTRGTLIQTVEATGELESFDKVDLSFGATGTVQEVFVEVGDEVKTGDLLATLDLSKIEADLNSAWQAVEIARANLEQKQAGSTNEAVALSESQVGAAEAALAAAESSLENVQVTTAASVAAAETNLSNAQDDLANEEVSNEQDLTAAYEDFFLVLKNNVIEVREALSEADEILGIDNTLANNDFEDILSANDYQALVSANNSYQSAVTYRDQAEDLILTLSLSSSSEEIDSAATTIETTLLKTAETLLYVRRVLDATNVDNADFSSDDLSTLKTNIDAARASIQIEEEAFNNQSQVVDQLITTNEIEINEAENLVDKYERAWESAKAEAAASLATATSTVSLRQADLAEAQASLTQVEASPRTVDLASYEAALAQAEANYFKVQVVADDNKIFAPIDGRITSVDLEPGEEAVTATSVIVVQTATTKYQVTVDISESDISKVSLNDKVELTFDAFGDDQKFSGYVVKINPAEKNIDGVIYYEIKVYLDDDNQAAAWKPGMTANVTITTVKKDGVLLVSQRAVLEHADGSKYVRFPVGDSFKEQTVEIGVRGDGGLSEVISGVEEGQTVIVSLR